MRASQKLGSQLLVELSITVFLDQDSGNKSAS